MQNTGIDDRTVAALQDRLQLNHLYGMRMCVHAQNKHTRTLDYDTYTYVYIYICMCTIETQTGSNIP
jgi:hypothetical protein